MENYFSVSACIFVHIWYVVCASLTAWARTACNLETGEMPQRKWTAVVLLICAQFKSRLMTAWDNYEKAAWNIYEKHMRAAWPLHKHHSATVLKNYKNCINANAIHVRSALINANPSTSPTQAPTLAVTGTLESVVHECRKHMQEKRRLEPACDVTCWMERTLQQHKPNWQLRDDRDKTLYKRCLNAAWTHPDHTMTPFPQQRMDTERTIV